MVRYSLLAANVLLLVFVVGFVIDHPSNSQASGQNSLLATAEPNASPLDQVSSADVASRVAQVTNLPEKIAVNNQADSVKAQLSFVPADSKVVAKPQVVATDLKSRRDIQKYVTKPGDTVGVLAAKFNITTDSIKWSNDLTTDALAAGRTLTIPPVSGFTYVVKAGDTPQTLAAKYGISKEQIIAFNDAEIDALPVGQLIVIPNGTKVKTGGFAWGGYTPTYGRNAYDYGWCTWYAASKIAVPGNWGNANTWDDYARRSGWTVSSAPRVGAVAQSNAGWAGHVAVVEAVSEDGKMIKYSDMNGLAGWGAVGYSGWIPANAKYQYFIYR